MSDMPNDKENFSDMLGRVLGDPEALSTISDMVQRLRSESTSSPSGEEASGSSLPLPAKEGQTVSPPPDLASALSHLSSPAYDRRASLLRALKPYLSPGRGEAIEYIIKISRLSELLKNI